jgi:hypothetical protein
LTILIVMAGLVPAIHAVMRSLTSKVFRSGAAWMARNKSGHDGGGRYVRAYVDAPWGAPRRRLRNPWRASKIAKLMPLRVEKTLCFQTATIPHLQIFANLFLAESRKINGLKAKNLVFQNLAALFEIWARIGDRFMQEGAPREKTISTLASFSIFRKRNVGLVAALILQWPSPPVRRGRARPTAVQFVVTFVYGTEFCYGTSASAS